MAFQLSSADDALLINGFVHVSGLRCLTHDLGVVAGLVAILIWRAGDFLPRARNVAIITQPELVRRRRQMDHRQRGNGSRHGTWRICVGSGRMGVRTVAVNNVLVTQKWRANIHTLRGRGIPCFCGSRSLFTCQIVLGESLLPRFSFPVIVADPSTVLNNSAAELTEH